MANPRVKFKGLLSLGAAIDSRIRSAVNRKRSAQAGSWPSVPLSQGGFPGGSGQGETPVVPETWVESLQAAGAATPLTGAIVVAGAGDTAVTQSGVAPHFTIRSPAISAADGVTRSGDEFSADATVVRTSGDQSIGGTKQFTAFPRTPAGIPAAENEAANKKYVDEEIIAAQLWRREAQVLSPSHDGDALRLDNELALRRTSAAAAALLLSITNESHPRLTMQQDGKLCWGGGGGMQDTQLQRQAAGVLAVGSGNAFRSGEYCGWH